MNENTKYQLRLATGIFLMAFIIPYIFVLLNQMNIQLFGIYNILISGYQAFITFCYGFYVFVTVLDEEIDKSLIDDEK